MSAQVTATGIRDGDPAVLHALVSRRGAAVLAYCERACAPSLALDAVADAFTRFRAAVISAERPGDIHPEGALLDATRHAAAARSPRPPATQATSGLARVFGSRATPDRLPEVPDLLAARAGGTSSPDDDAVLDALLATSPVARAIAERFAAAEEAYRAAPRDALPAPLAEQIVATMTALVSAPSNGAAAEAADEASPAAAQQADAALPADPPAPEPAEAAPAADAPAPAPPPLAAPPPTPAPPPRFFRAADDQPAFGPFPTTPPAPQDGSTARFGVPAMPDDAPVDGRGAADGSADAPPESAAPAQEHVEAEAPDEPVIRDPFATALEGEPLNAERPTTDEEPPGHDPFAGEPLGDGPLDGEHPALDDEAVVHDPFAADISGDEPLHAQDAASGDGAAAHVPDAAVDDARTEPIEDEEPGVPEDDDASRTIEWAAPDAAADRVDDAEPLGPLDERLSVDDAVPDGAEIAATRSADAAPSETIEWSVPADELDAGPELEHEIAAARLGGPGQEEDPAHLQTASGAVPEEDVQIPAPPTPAPAPPPAARPRPVNRRTALLPAAAVVVVAAIAAMVASGVFGGNDPSPPVDTGIVPERALQAVPEGEAAAMVDDLRSAAADARRRRLADLRQALSPAEIDPSQPAAQDSGGSGPP